VRSCSCHEASPQVIYSALITPSCLSCSSYALPSRPVPIFTLLWTLSNSFMSSLYCTNQNAPSAGGEAAQRENSSRPAGRAGPGAPQGTVGPLGCQGTLLVHNLLLWFLGTLHMSSVRKGGYYHLTYLLMEILGSEVSTKWLPNQDVKGRLLQKWSIYKAC